MDIAIDIAKILVCIVAPVSWLCSTYAWAKANIRAQSAEASLSSNPPKWWRDAVIDAKASIEKEKYK